MEVAKSERCVHCMGDVRDVTGNYCPRCGKSLREVDQPNYCLQPYSVLKEKYMVGRMLGQGGFGITYIGLDVALDIRVAIKEYYPMAQVTRLGGESSRLVWNSAAIKNDQWRPGCESFLREARKMAKIREVPAVVRVLDTFEENDTAYIVMDYVEGRTLMSKLKEEGPMTFHDTMELLRPLINAMDAVHKLGLIHRDLSPDNVMLQKDGTPRILDLGAAKEISVPNSPTSQLVAKKGFSPFEQYITGGDIGPWTDVYAMSVMIFYCVTGKMPPGSLERIENDTFTFPPGAFTPQVEEVLRQGMAVAKDNRIQSMQELLDRLDAASGDTAKPGTAQTANWQQPVSGGGAWQQPSQQNWQQNPGDYSGQQQNWGWQQQNYGRNNGFGQALFSGGGFQAVSDWITGGGWRGGAQPYDPSKIINIGGRTVTTDTKKLTIKGRGITDISELAKLTEINILSLEGNSISDVAPLAGLRKLVTLCLSRNNVSDITPLALLPLLNDLDVSMNRVKDLTPLSNLKWLTRLDLSRNFVENLAPLAGLTTLVSLSVHTNSISSVTALTGLVNLRELYLRSNSITDFRPLYSLTGLTRLDIRWNPVSGDQIWSLRSALPQCQILY